MGSISIFISISHEVLGEGDGDWGKVEPHQDAYLEPFTSHHLVEALRVDL